MSKSLILVVASLWLLTAPAFGSLLACNVNSVPTLLPATQPTGQVGDMVIYCLGGTPTDSGVLIPSVDITVFVSVPVVSSSAPTLSVNEPEPGTELLCNSLSGCPMYGTSGASNPYDGSPGRPNIFLGTLVPGSVQFLGFPFDAPGDSAGLSLRLSGMSIGLSPGPFVQIQASVVMTGDIQVPLSNAQQIVADAQVGAPVPEPSGLSLAAMGLGIVAWGIRRRRASRG